MTVSERRRHGGSQPVTGPRRRDQVLRNNASAVAADERRLTGEHFEQTHRRARTFGPRIDAPR